MYNAFVPYYPLLTTDTADVYKYSPRRSSARTSSPPGVWYKDQKGRYYTYPEDWTKSFYGARDALSNLLTYGDVSGRTRLRPRQTMPPSRRTSWRSLQR